MKSRLIIAIFIFLSAINFSAYSQEVDAEALTNKIERYVYGEAQPGELASRLRQLEEDLFGRNTGRIAADKAYYLNNLIFAGTTNSPSLDMRLSYLEWRIFNKTGQGSLERRVNELSRQITGSTSYEPLAFRLEQLIHLSIEDGLITMHPVTIPRGTEITLSLSSDMSSAVSKRGDIAPFEISSDLFLNNNILVMTKGGIITARVGAVRRGGRFGRTGYMNLNFGTIDSMDSTAVPVEISDSAQERFDKRSLGKAIGASTVGYFVLGPLGVAGGAFVKGDDVEIPSGTEITVRVTEDTPVKGVLVHRR